MNQELKKYELPESWKWVKLGEVCTKMSNGVNAKQSDEKIGLAISRIETIWNETIDWNRVKYILENEKEFIEKYALKENDILFSHINSDIHLGKTAIYKNQTQLLIHGINLLLIRFNKDVLPDFFNYQFKYKRRRGEFSSIAQKSVNQSSINQPKLKNTDFVLPPKPVQQAIVSKIEELFSELDKGIETLRFAQQQLKTYRQAVLKWAFEGKLTEEWRQMNRSSVRIQSGSKKEIQVRVLSKLLSESVAAEPFGKYQKNGDQGFDNSELPHGWKWTKISNIATINPKLPNKESIESDLAVQFLPMKLVEEIINKIHLTETKKFIEVQKGSYTPFIDGDVIFAKVTPCMENGKIAVVDKLKNGIGYGSSEFHVVRCQSEVLNSYLFYFLVQDKFRNEAENAMTGAVGLRRVPKQFIENHTIPLPTIEEQQEVVSEIETRLSVADKMEEGITQSLQQAEALRQSILKKAFEGRLV